MNEPTDADRAKAHDVLRAWLLATPAVEAQIRTDEAQFELERQIAAALAEERAKAHRAGWTDGYGQGRDDEADNLQDRPYPEDQP